VLLHQPVVRSTPRSQRHLIPADQIRLIWPTISIENTSIKRRKLNEIHRPEMKKEREKKYIFLSLSLNDKMMKQVSSLMFLCPANPIKHDKSARILLIPMNYNALKPWQMASSPGKIATLSLRWQN